MPAADVPDNQKENTNENPAPDRPFSVDRDTAAAVSFNDSLHSVLQACDADQDAELTEAEIDTALQNPTSLDAEQQSRLHLMKDYFSELSAMSGKPNSIASGDLFQLAYIHFSMDMHDHFAEEAKEYAMTHFDEMDSNGDGMLKGQEFGTLDGAPATHEDDLKFYLSRYRKDIVGPTAPGAIGRDFDDIEMSRDDLNALTVDQVKDSTIMDLYRGAYVPEATKEPRDNYQKVMKETSDNHLVWGSAGLSATALLLVDIAEVKAEYKASQIFQRDHAKIRVYLRSASS